jgi:hypothetical protein
MRTRQACKVVRIDPDRFNEHCAAGRYTCAPPTVAGKPREFNADDMVALMAFADLCHAGMKAEVAGRIAAWLRGPVLRDRDPPIYPLGEVKMMFSVSMYRHRLGQISHF